jgi:nucleoside-diphosphate-sugar epimerase
MSDAVLVTGASGFVGACAVRELVERGHAVHVLLRDLSRPWRLAGLGNRITAHVGDLVDFTSVRRCLAVAKPRVVLHLAAHGGYEHQTDSSAILGSNIAGTIHLLQASAESDVELVVQTGSSSEYGFRYDPMCEDDRLEPNSVYAVAKAAQTHLGALWARRTGMAVVTLRLFSVYGPWEEPTRLIPTLLRRARAGLPLLMVTPDTVRDFVYIEDVLAALCDFQRLAHLGGETINVGSGEQTTMRDIVTVVLDLLKSGSEVCWNAYPARSWDTTHWCADVRKARRLLGWTPCYSLKDGLARTAEWMLSFGDDHGQRLAG